MPTQWFVVLGAAITLSVVAAPVVHASGTTTGYIATTTLTTSICGNGLVEPGEQCDAPGETGAYSTSIAGRQCTPQCKWGPYCGDGILQTRFGEQCDDGNNQNGDFCSATCKIEPAGSGGGGGSGGGSAPSGGSNVSLGDTQVSIDGVTIPSATVNILMDGKSVGSVQADSKGAFTFAKNASPGTVSLGFWVSDPAGTKSIILNNTFDVTQGAITNVSGVLVPATIKVDKANANPGDTLNFSGYAPPNATIELFIDGTQTSSTTVADASGAWHMAYDTTGISAAQHIAQVRYVVGSGTLTSQSGYSSSLQLFIGVNGSPTSPSDLNRDGKVNLTDFSILIFWWGTNGGNSDPPADINQDGTVGLADFSIMLYNWTG